MNLSKSVLMYSILFFHMSFLNAAWNPRYVTLDQPEKIEILNSPEFKALENDVCAYLKNTWCSQEKARLMLELITITKPKVSVEVGAFTGSSALPILSAINFNDTGYAFIIDSWSSEEATRGLPADEENTIWWSKLDMNYLKNQFDKMIATWSLDSTFYELRMPSQEAVFYIPSIDFLHLDGNFTEEGAYLDSEVYSSKVVPGGYILLSNALITIGGKTTKMKALVPLFERCNIICELDHGNTLLFRKKLQN